MKDINEWRVQVSTNKTLLSVDKNGWTFNTNIAEVLAANITVSTFEDVEFAEWTAKNEFANGWYCKDLCNYSVLKVAIGEALHKSPHDVKQRHLIYDENDGQQNQFVAFVSSHRTGYVLNSFHIHSFAVFHINTQESTIVTCILTARNHLLSNMQDQCYVIGIWLAH